MYIKNMKAPILVFFFIFIVSIPLCSAMEIENTDVPDKIWTTDPLEISYDCTENTTPLAEYLTLSPEA